MSQRKRWIVAVLLVAFAGALPGCGKRVSTAPMPIPKLFEPRPLIWRAVAPGGDVAYLFGSVHITRREIDDFGSVVEQAWEASDELVVEVDVSRLSSDERMELTARYGALPRGHTLRDVLSETTSNQLAEYLVSRGIAQELVAGWKPWFVHIVVVQHELERAGFKIEQGVDRLYLASARRSNRPVAALETAASQLQAFDNLPDPLEELLLQDSLGRVDGFADEARGLIDAWGDGSEAELAEHVFRPLAEAPELEVFYDLIFFQRNRQMAARLDAMAGDGVTRFVIVGAGHMVGAQGIPSLLAERGWQVTRIGGKP